VSEVTIIMWGKLLAGVGNLCPINMPEKLCLLNKNGWKAAMPTTPRMATSQVTQKMENGKMPITLCPDVKVAR
jgi:hypothetical protein